MIYRLIAKNKDGMTLIADYYKKQDAIDKKRQFKLWDSLNPENAKHIVKIYPIPEGLYEILREKEENGEYIRFE